MSLLNVPLNLRRPLLILLVWLMKRTKGLDYGKEKAEERQSLMYESTSFEQRRKLSEELYGKGLALIKAPTESVTIRASTNWKYISIKDVFHLRLASVGSVICTPQARLEVTKYLER